MVDHFYTPFEEGEGETLFQKLITQRFEKGVEHSIEIELPPDIEPTTLDLDIEPTTLDIEPIISEKTIYRTVYFSPPQYYRTAIMKESLITILGLKLFPVRREFHCVEEREGGDEYLSFFSCKMFSTDWTTDNDGVGEIETSRFPCTYRQPSRVVSFQVTPISANPVFFTVEHEYTEAQRVGGYLRELPYETVTKVYSWNPDGTPAPEVKFSWQAELQFVNAYLL